MQWGIFEKLVIVVSATLTTTFLGMVTLNILFDGEMPKFEHA